MIKNYIRIAWRSLKQNKLLSGINILGLAVGIACCLLIAMYVLHEKSYDRFHKNADRIVRATMELSYNGNLTKVPVTGTKVLPEFKRVFPEVEGGVRTFPVNTTIGYDGKLFLEKQFVYSTDGFFDVFSFRLLRGNPREALAKPNQLVLTSSAAKKYFGDADPIGKVLKINNENDFVIVGIAEDCPANSQIRFSVLASWSSLTDPVYTTESWMDASHYTYLLLKRPGMEKALEEKVHNYFKSQNEGYRVPGKDYIDIRVQPLTDVHLNAIVEGGFEPGGDNRYVYIFSGVALLVLIIACANYVNLTTARASERAREVGVRKVIGASRKRLFGQFISESVVTVFVSLLISLLLVKLFISPFNTITGKQLELNFLLNPAGLVALGTILFVIGFLGSIYPALVLSGFQPISILKGNVPVNASGIGLRKTLFVAQFFISVALIVSTLVIQEQLGFIQNKKLGYNNDHVLVLRSDAQTRTKMNTVKTELSANRNVLGVTTCNQTPTFIPGKYNLNIDDKEMVIAGVRVDKDFIKTMGMDIRSGVDFTTIEEQAAFKNTDTIQRPLIINEATVRTFGWTNENAIGKKFKFQGRNSIVKAVVADFHFSSMHETISPIVIFLAANTSRILVRLSANDLGQTLSYIRSKWSELAPQLPFEYEFMDEQFDKLYAAETRTGKIFYAFALLAIALACLGLSGLATFTAYQRTKEIGIRKVLGASVSGIVLLLSKDFLKLVLIAIIIASPVAWWLMNKWLEDFAYRVNITWTVFLVAGAAAIMIALITLSFQAIRAAMANPVKSLRTE
jgi:putative ABC transport system permease protein